MKLFKKLFRNFYYKLQQKRNINFFKNNRKLIYVYLDDTNLIIFKIKVIKLGQSYDIYKKVFFGNFYKWEKVESNKERYKILGKIYPHKDYKCYYHPYYDIYLGSLECQYEFEFQCLGLDYPYKWSMP